MDLYHIPFKHFSLKVYLATTYTQIQEACLRLKAIQPLTLGFDTETSRNQSRVSLIQLSTKSECYLLQVGIVFDQNKSLPQALYQIINDPDVVKIGVGLDHDAELLRKSFNMIIRSGIDIQTIARTMKEDALSLRDLANKHIVSFPGKDPIGHQGNWDTTLNEHQVYYAVSDAYHSLILYQRLILPNESNYKDKGQDSDINLYQIWLQAYIKSKNCPLAFTSLVNYTVNSYGPWRKLYSESERRKKAEEVLTILSKIIPFDQDEKRFLPHNPD